jgi:YfiH family protein
MSLTLIQPDWPAPARVKAFVSQRQGGVSVAPYSSLNLATHVGDNPLHVQQNRALIAETLNFPSEPFWLNQVHGTRVVNADEADADDEDVPLVQADGSWSHTYNRVLAIMTADCVPILLTDRCGSFVMALHAGWHGLSEGIIHNAVKTAGLAPNRLLAWVGPAIGFAAYEVSNDVRDVFLMSRRADAIHFKPSDKEGHCFADLAGIALWQLEQMHVCWIGGGHWCTFDRPEQFFSYRRHGITGRMASFIWLEH